MATRMITTLVDDFDGGPADETLTLTIDGTTYEIDLSTENATDLRDALAPWLAKARVTARAAGSHRRSPTRSLRADTAALRTWARENGWPNLGDRGRIPAAAHAAYQAAKAGQA